jgi:hypothetical protein
MLCAAGACVVLVLAALLAPPILHDWASMSAKAGTNSVMPESLYRTLLMQLGTGRAWLGALLLVALLTGIARIWRRDREFTALVLSGALVGNVVICLARPAWIQHAPALLRYTVVLLPFLLLFVAEGIVAAIERVATPWNAVLGAAIIAALVALGPLPSWYYRPNQFMEHQLFQFDYALAENPFVMLLHAVSVPAFYQQLALRPPGSVKLIQAPRRAESDGPDVIEQQQHHQLVKHALVGSVCGANDRDILSTAQGTRFRWVLELSDVLDGRFHGADYLVLNLHPWLLVPSRLTHWPDMAACTDKVAARLGAPVFRDDDIVVFALSEAAKNTR